MSIIVDKGTLLKVLDHGYVRLIDYMGNDESIIEAARMSTGRGFEGWEKDAGLLDFLWRNRHTSPFEMCEMVIEVYAPIFVFREWHRHRTQSYNEFSARYAQMADVHYLPERSRIQRQGKTNKQSSDDVAMEEAFATEFIEDLKDQQEHVYSSYDEAVKLGVAKEIARINTPVSRYSKMRAKTDLLNWIRFLNLRLRPNAQFEIRQYAEVVSQLLRWRFPKTMDLFEEYDLFAASFSRSEMKALRLMLLNNRNRYEAAKEIGLAASKAEEFFKKLDKGGEEIL